MNVSKRKNTISSQTLLLSENNFRKVQKIVAPGTKKTLYNGRLIDTHRRYIRKTSLPKEYYLTKLNQCNSPLFCIFFFFNFIIFSSYQKTIWTYWNVNFKTSKLTQYATYMWSSCTNIFSSPCRIYLFYSHHHLI